MEQIFLYKDAPDIAIIKLSSLGDIIHTIPAFNILRKEFPESKISWIVEPNGAKFLKHLRGLDQIIIINLKKKGLKNKYRELKKFIKRNKHKFDIIIDFQGLIKSALLGFLIGNKSIRIGFNKNNIRKEKLASKFYTIVSDKFNEEKNHVIYKNIELLKTFKPIYNEINYPINDIIPSKKILDFFKKNKLKAKKYILVNTGGKWETKRLSIDQNINIIENIKKRINDLKVIIIWGNKDERKTATRIAKKTKSLLSPKTNFSDLFFLVKHSCLAITGDTFILHVADMFNTISIAYFGPTSPIRNGSILNKSVSVYKKLPCSFCYKRKCDKMECIKDLPINKIITKVVRLYEECG